MLHIDAHLSNHFAADEAMEMVARMAKVGKDLKQRIMKEIYA